MVADGQYFNGELMEISISSMIGKIVNKASAVCKMSFDWEMKIFLQLLYKVYIQWVMN